MSYDELCATVRFMLKNEGPMNVSTIVERTSSNRAHVGLVLRNLESSGKLLAAGYPKVYSWRDGWDG